LRFIRKTDFIAVAAILLAAGVLLLFRLRDSSPPAAAEIYLNGELIKTVPLHTGEERSFSLPEREKVVFHLYPDGAIAFESSDCPDKVCVHTGRLRRAGQTAACLPNGLLLKIAGGADGPDAVL